MESPYRWVIVAAGGLLGCVAIGSMFSLPIFLQPMAKETGWSVTGISTAMTIGFLAMAGREDVEADDDGKDVQGYGDFDGDGRDDVLWRYFDGQLEIDFANGAVTFPSWQNRGEAVGLDWQVESVRDHDGDGHADIVWRHAEGPTTVWLMVGDTHVGEVEDGMEHHGEAATRVAVRRSASRLGGAGARSF